MNDEKLNLILRANQLIIRDRQFYTGSGEEQANIIDQEITEILNPKKETELSEKTKEHFALSEGDKK